ncbi:cytochrome c [Roseovarius arcticus]|uniref:cytochrome c n=1 Tax=Roseovarius arcticus TaxID=2547404 RepID=UPI001FE953A9|nr:cytochrome c [Roseovarius arcticus]
MTLMGKVLRGVGALVVVAVVVLFAIIFVPVQRTPAQVHLAADDIVVSGSGEYVMRLADCAACHTAKDREPFAGGYPIESPLGTIYSSNITPDPEHGIGDWTLADFRAALYDGIDEEGRHLYPAMPSANYRKLSEADIGSLYDYLMNDVEPVANDPPETELSFPFNQRWGLRLWKWVAYKDAGFAPRYGDAVLDRGAYLVEGPGHCSACHSPRTALFVQSGYTPDDSAFLSGGIIDGWAVPALRGPGSASAMWDEAQMVAFLQSGRNAHSGVAGEMALVVDESLQYMTDADVTAVARYLRHVATDDDALDTPALASADPADTETAAMLLAASPDMELGARLYLDNCNACHFNTGMGADEVFPELVGNSTVLADEPDGFLHVILNGAQLPSTATRPSRLRMPPFRDRLSDDEVAALATFVRQAWGNDAAPIAAATVGGVRKKTSDSDIIR